MTAFTGDADRPFDRFQIAADMLIERLIKCFEVNVQGIDLGEDFPQRFFTKTAIGYQHIF